MPQLISFGCEEFLDLFEERVQLRGEGRDNRLSLCIRHFSCRAVRTDIQEGACLGANDPDLCETVCFLKRRHCSLRCRPEVRRRRGNFQESFRDKNLLQFFYVSAGHA